MALDPSIILGFKQYTGPDANETMRTLSDLALRGVQQRQGEATLASMMEQQNQQRAQDNVYRNNAKNMEPGLPRDLMSIGQGPAAFAAQDQQAQMSAKQADHIRQQAELLGRPLVGLKDQAGLDAAFSAWKRAGIPDQELANMPREYNEQTAPIFERIAGMSLSPKDQQDLAIRKDTLEETKKYHDDLKNRPPMMIPIIGEGGAQFGWNPRAPNAPATPIKDNTGRQLVKPPPARTAVDNENLLDEATIDQTARAYAVDPTTKLQGLTKKDRAAVMNRAAVIGGDLATNKAQYRANIESLKKQQAQADATESYETTAWANVQNFLEQAKKIRDTGSPLFNASAREFDAKVAGDPEMAALEAMRQTAYNEVAKVLSGASGGAAMSDSARHEAEGLFPKDATIAQWVRTAEMLKKDMDSRKASVEESIARINKRNADLIKPKNKQALAPAANAGEHPEAQAALEWAQATLKKNPNDEKAKAILERLSAAGAK